MLLVPVLWTGGLVGNLFVLWAVLASKTMRRSSMNVLLTNLVRPQSFSPFSYFSSIFSLN
jgi:hypothetical protein